MARKRMTVYLLVLGIISPLAHAVDFGGIKGRVNYCGQGGLDGMLVYIPGRQFSVITDQSGRFEFEFLPVGQYDIYYRHAGKLLNYNRNIKVTNDAVTELATIAICDSASVAGNQDSSQPAVSGTSASPAQGLDTVDNDGDGFNRKLDCNDNDATIRPGAIELCDGKDNNCNGAIDENAQYMVDNGSGKCINGVIVIEKCSSHYADCDNDFRNGCETDLNSSQQNCGACGNACSDLEICALGIC